MILIGEDDFIVGGTGILQNNPGQRLTLRELTDTMLAYSDNSAGNLLLDRLGGFASINALAADLSLTDTSMARLFMDFEARDRGEDNYIRQRSSAANRSLGRRRGGLYDCLGERDDRIAQRQETFPSWSGRDLPSESIHSQRLMESSMTNG